MEAPDNTIILSECSFCLDLFAIHKGISYDENIYCSEDCLSYDVGESTIYFRKDEE